MLHDSSYVARATVSLVLSAVWIGGADWLHAEPPAPPTAPVVVPVTAETDPVPSDDDAADDPCVWVHPTDPAKSLIIGTDKGGGVLSFDLAGKIVQDRREGKLNNIDLRENFDFGDRKGCVLVASNRTRGTLTILTIDPTTRELRDVAARALPIGFEPYGACLYHSRKSGKLFAFVNAKTGAMQQWELFANAGKVDGRLTREFSFATQVEGCVADDDMGRLYVGEEAAGLWRLDAEPDANADRDRHVVDRTTPDGRFAPDVEGMTLYRASNGAGYLIVSSQGNSQFLVYERGGANKYIGAFVIGASGGMLGASGTDGIDVCPAPLGPRYPAGLFIAQSDNPRGRQTFKLVSWPSIAKAFSPPLLVDPRPIDASVSGAAVGK